VFISK